MTDTTLNRFLSSGTAAQRAAFTPSVPTPASGPSQAYTWYETDTGDTYIYASGGWHKISVSGGSGGLTLIEKHQFTGSEASYNFAAIPGAYTSLELDIFGRGASSGVYYTYFQVNGLSTNIYSLQRHFAQANSPASDELLDAGAGRATIHGYSQSALHKVLNTQGGQPNNTSTNNSYVFNCRGIINLTAAITSLTIFGSLLNAGGGNFTSDSYAALYGRS